MQKLSHLRAYLSVFMIVATLLVVVFMQMEERRLGYAVLHLTREHRKLSELKQKKELNYTKLTRPQYVEKLATLRRDMKKVRPEQVIQLSGGPD